MLHDPLVCIEDAIKACELILEFTEGLDGEEYFNDSKTKAAIEREFEIIGEALNRIKNINIELLSNIDNWKEIIGFRNVIIHGYDVIEDEIVWDTVKRNIPELLTQLKRLSESLTDFY